MNFNSNNVPSERVFNASKPFSSQLGPAFIMDKENILLDNTWIHEWLSRGSDFNKSNVPERVSALGMDMSPKKKRSPFRDGKSSMSPHQIIGKRGPPLDDIIAPVSPQKKRRVDVARGLQAEGNIISNGVSHTKHGLRIPNLLPIQWDSWYYLPEMWDYCGPDGRHIKKRRWSPNADGDHSSTAKSNRLNQKSDRENATAATVATWVELNRLRVRYQELVADFHGGPLVVHHLADKESDKKLVAIAQASEGLEKAMAGIGRAAPPHPRLSWATAPAPAPEPIKRPMGAIATQIGAPIFVSPLDKLLSVTPAKVVSQESTPAPTLTTLPATLPAPPVSPPYNPLDNAAHPPRPAPSILQEQEAIAPSNLPRPSKPTKRTQKATRTPQPTTPAATSSAPLSVVSSTGQFRFTPAGEARFKLLYAQGEYDEMWEMLPAEQHFDHITTPSAIAAFRSEHPRPNKGENGRQKVETELWVCKAKVKIERKTLSKVKKGDATEELSIVYSDEPCNGVAGTTCNMGRHKKRTHLGRPYNSNATEEEGGKKQKKQKK